MMLMLDWLWKKFGYHVCEEFTQWETHKARFQRPATSKEVIWNEVTVVEYTRRWQERRCTLCGQLQQRQLGL